MVEALEVWRLIFKSRKILIRHGMLRHYLLITFVIFVTDSIYVTIQPPRQGEAAEMVFSTFTEGKEEDNA